MASDMKDFLRKIPSVNELVETDELTSLIGKYSRSAVVEAARNAVEEFRERIRNSNSQQAAKMDLSIQAIAGRAAELVETGDTLNLRNVINATGIILHTNLGRAVLSEKAVEAVNEIAGGYSSLEMELSSGKRGRRDSNVTDLLCGITGAESATVVNNNAAATMIILKTLAYGREVIVSRGQLVEIGGSYRIPEVMRESGATLVEVGTTNKTHLRDYNNAINENTALLLHVHQSNYRIVGFTSQVPIEELAELGKERGIPVVDDLGSGALLDYSKFGLACEPTVQASVAAGAEAICFSADKLLGGPQAGIILGKEKIIQSIRKNPLARAIRVGKLTLAALEATLRLFRHPDALAKDHRLFRMISLTKDEMTARAKGFIKRLKKVIPGSVKVDLADGSSEMGGGSLSGAGMETTLVAVRSQAISPDETVGKLRHCNPPVICRIRHDSVIMDLRTVQEHEEDRIIAALKEVLAN